MRYRLAQTIESTDEDTTIVNKKYVDDIKSYLEELIGKTPTKTYLIGTIANKSISVDENKVSLKWSDPVDIVVDETVKAAWSHTIIVKKEGSIPSSPTDGTTVVDSTVRDQYATDAYVDTQENPENWYYRAFPYQESGEYNSNINNIFYQNPIKYGFCIDQGNSDESTCVSYIAGCDNENYEKAYMDFTTDTWNYGSWENAFFMPRPCMLKNDGTVDYYLDPNDYSKKEDGTSSDIYNMDYEGNAMMEFPKMFYKAENNNGVISVYISDTKIDSNYECFSCLKSDGTYNDYFYVAIYEGYIDSKGYLRSMCPENESTASTKSNLTVNRTAAVNNGSGWDIDVLADYEHIRVLAVLMCKRLNFRKAVSVGVYNGTTHNNIGVGNTLGMFYGKDTLTTSNEFNVKFFGIENLWGNYWRYLLGIKYIWCAYYIKMTKHTGDGSLGADYIENNADNYSSNYIHGFSTTLGTSQGNITSMLGYTSISSQKYSVVFLPSSTTDSTTFEDYYCCEGEFKWGNASVCSAFGGINNETTSDCGLFSIAAALYTNDIYSDAIASLTYRQE